MLSSLIISPSVSLHGRGASLVSSPLKPLIVFFMSKLNSRRNMVALKKTKLKEKWGGLSLRETT